MGNITFMIGNGFDLQLGLDTRYNDFLKWYLNQPSKNKNIADFKIELVDDKSSPWWSDAEIAMGEYVGGFKPDTMGDYFERIRDFKIEMVNYLTKQQERCDYSDVDTIGNSFVSFLLNFQNDILLPDKVGEQFSRRQHTNYNFINFNYTNSLEKLIEAVFEIHQQGIVYSTLISKGQYVAGRVGQVVAIHGSLNSQIIMGVNDDSQLNISHESISDKLRRTLIKPETNRALGRTENERAIRMIHESDVIAIYGLKLGETDKKWREAVCDWLHSAGHYIVVFGHQEMENSNRYIPEDVLDFVDEKQTEFLAKLFGSENREDISDFRDQVYIIDKSKYLDFDVVKKQPLTV